MAQILTCRQLEALSLIAHGYSWTAIMDKTGLSRTSLSGLLSRARKRLGAVNNMSAVYKAAALIRANDEREPVAMQSFADDLISTGEACRMLYVDSSTLRRWRSRGIIKGYCLHPNGQTRYRRGDVIFLAQSCSAGVQE